MNEPISKKTGTQFRKARAQKNEEFRVVMTRTKTIQSFFHFEKPISKDHDESSADTGVRGEIDEPRDSEGRLDLQNNDNNNSIDENSVGTYTDVREEIDEPRDSEGRLDLQNDENNNSIDENSVGTYTDVREEIDEPRDSEGRLDLQNDENNNSIDENSVGTYTDVREEIETQRDSDADAQSGAIANSEMQVFLGNGSVLNLESISDDPTKWCKNDFTFLENFLKVKMEQNINELDLSQSKRCLSGVNRSCTYGLFFKKMINGEVRRRSWIFFSESLGKMFCIYCKFFAIQSGPFVSSGFDDWKHSSRIADHETSKVHCEAAYIFTTRITKLNNIDSELAQQIIVQQKYWKEVLHRIASTIRFLASRGLPFRGKNEHLGDSRNGNYLGMLELIAEYDPLLKSHLEKYGNKGRGNTSYLSSTICDEFVELLAAEVKSKILTEIKNYKYFSLIVDSTPDVAHLDQLTIVIRYVNEKGVIVERFLAFLENVGHKGKDMVDALLDFLKDAGIIILDCRGQAYDNAKNMSGIYKGLQARILALNPLAKYVPCGGHSLNLVLQHAAEGTSDVVRFFMFVQNIYTFFSQSTKRWEILTAHLKNDLLKRKEKDPRARMLVPKKLSATRWSARDDACRALKVGYGAVAAALKEIFENAEEKKVTQVEAESLYDELFKLETAVLLEFWSHILHKANVVSKSLQNVDVDIKTSISLIESLLTYIKKLRTEESFKNFQDNSKTLIQSCPEWETKNSNLTYNCYNKRKRPRNRKYDASSSDDTVFEDSQKFRITIFYTMLDSVISELESIAVTYRSVLQPFDFLFNLEILSDSNIRQGATELKNIYHDDLDEDFIDECIHFKFFMDHISQEVEQENETFQDESASDEEEIEGAKVVSKKKKVSKPAKMLQYIKKHEISSTFPNIEVALRIFESIAIANCSGERSFSALKRVKNYQRSTVKDKKLNNVAVLYIENDILKQLDTDLIIDKFVSAKCRKRFI